MLYRVGMHASGKHVVAGASAVLQLFAFASWGRGEGGDTHWPLAPTDLEQILAIEDFEILGVKGDVGGVMGVRKLRVRFPDSDQELSLKWKRAPDGDADGWNNTPRKEIAAYALQKWFLDPADYVVPTIVARCIPLDLYTALDDEPEPNLRGSRCVMGVLVAWIENVGLDGPIYEEERFRNDAVYAHHMADFNLLTYLIEHEDGRRSNFLTSDDPARRAIFSIDNGVSFGAKIQNWFVPNWDKIRVPALRELTLERLREAAPSGLPALGVVAELRAGEDGVLRPVEPSANADPDRGSRGEPGWIQLGLTRQEIAGVERRVDRLLADVEAKRVALF